MLPSPHLPAAAPARPASPPDFPDAVHLPYGCFISTFAYLAKFAAAFPGEQGIPVTTILPHNGQHHTAALVTWAGEWWLRDEFLGVVRLRIDAGAAGPASRARQAGEAVLRREAPRLSRERRRQIAGAAADLTAAEAVAQAARLLPLPSEAYLVAAGGAEFPVLFFRPGPREIAVYDPRHGTATAETDSLRHAAIVEAVARRLGYRVTAVRRDFGPLLAATGR